jgi:hypothetical protein
MARKQETHYDRFRKYGGISFLFGVLACVGWHYVKFPLTLFAFLAFAGGVLGALTSAIMSAGSFVLFLLQKMKRNG